MKSIVYISTSVKLLNQSALLDILTVSRRNNTANNLTGMLLYSEGTFIQALEGDDDMVDAVFAIIEQDHRHKNIIKVACTPIEKRNFPEWKMGFKSVSPAELEEFNGYIKPDKGFLQNDEVSTAIIMLQTFADSNRISD